MKRFKFHPYVHIFNSISIALNFIVFVFLRSYLDASRLDYILFLFAAIASYNTIKYLQSSYTVNKSGLIKTSLFKKEFLGWNEIEQISALPASRGNKLVVGIAGKDKQILVSYWVKDYRYLIKMVIKGSRGNGKVIIDSVLVD